MTSNTQQNLSFPLNNLSIDIYPNPAKEEIRLTSSMIIKEIRIFNTNGQVIYHAKANTKTVLLHLYQGGVFFIQLFTADNIVSKKIIVR